MPGLGIPPEAAALTDPGLRLPVRRANTVAQDGSQRPAAPQLAAPCGPAGGTAHAQCGGRAGSLERQCRPRCGVSVLWSSVQ